MNSLDYQQECSITRYPFKDSANLIWTRGAESGVLPNNIFLDAQLVLFSNVTGNLTLASIIRNLDSWFFTFNGIATITVAVSGSGIQEYAVRSESNLILLRISIDVDNLLAYFIQNSLSIGLYNFGSSNKFCLSCIKLVSPSITRLELVNQTVNGVEVVSDIVNGPLNLAEGSNVSFSLNNKLGISVLSGAGTGLYSNCPIPGSRVTSVNDVSPDLFGDLQFQTDPCFATYSGTAGLYIKNNCIPECTAPDIVNFAHYFNRVRDFSNQLTSYLDDATTRLNDYLAQYTFLEELRMNNRNPYLIAQATSLSNKAGHYHNVTYGIYAPGTEPTTVNLSASINDSKLTYLANSNYTLIENVNRKSTDLVINSNSAQILTNHSLKCNSVMYGGFVLSQQASTNNVGESYNDIVFRLTGLGGYVLPLRPTTFNYAIAYNHSIISGRKVVNFVVTLLDPQLVTVNTVLSVGLPGIFTVLNSELVANSVVTVSGSAGFGTTAINYSKTNEYRLTISCDAGITAPQTISFSGQGRGLTIKSVTV